MIYFLALIAGVLLVSGAAKGSEGISPSMNLDDLFKASADKYSLEDWKVLKAIAIIESDLGKNSLVKQGLVSEDGKSYGLMQLTIPTASSLAGRPVSSDELNQNSFSIDLAGKLFQELEATFPDDLQSQVRAYNGGPKLAHGSATLPYWKKFVNAYQSIGGQM